ncbi:hypothetical protein [Paenibacillus sanguinis]|uniref:hypothetical protein n=1 Tax=Paenibacillus sanguinis TaxID=225906 RepID=UPI00036B8511|nr:hypothetical protein [Paenibacillus sanguinis]
MSALFSKCGIFIAKKNGRYLLSYDEGGLFIRYRTIEITPEEAEKAMHSPEDAYELLITLQNRERSEKEKRNNNGRK